MANSISGFYQTLVAAADEASKLLAPTWNAADSVYRDFKPEAAAIGQTIDVAIPQDPTNSVSDVGVGDIPITDIGFSMVPIPFDKHPAFGYKVANFEQFNSNADIRNVFLDAALTGIKNHINARVAALFTASNFATNAPVSTTGSLVTTTQFLAAQALLLNQNVPVNDAANMSLLLPADPYVKMLDNANWTQAQIAGNQRAEEIHTSGVMPTSYGASLKVDQQMLVSGTTPSRTYTGAYLHKWAIAIVTRPLPQPDGNVVHYTYMDFRGIPILIQIGWNQIKSGYVVTVEAGYGLKVVRPEMCQLFSIAE